VARAQNFNFLFRPIVVGSLTRSALRCKPAKAETPLYDALKLSVKELAREAPRRRKAIVVLTDGLDTQSAQW